MSEYILFLAKLKGRRRYFLDGARGAHIVRLAPRAPNCHRKWKSLSFCKIWENPAPPLFFIRLPKFAGHGILWEICGKIPGHIKSKESSCQEGKGLAITYSLQKKMFWGNMLLSYSPCFTWTFFMIWFHKILKFIFQTQPSCPRKICTEHWWKLPNLTAFLEIFLIP